MRVRIGLVIGVLVLLAAAGAGVWWVQRAGAGDDSPSEGRARVTRASERVLDTSALAPANVRVRVRVLNGTDTNGLARRATQLLRDHGYDVVDYNTASEQSEATLIDVTADSREWGARIVRALGGGTVREQSDPLPYADVVVTLGSDWQPPAQPFRP